jgi:hypothetical protein
MADKFEGFANLPEGVDAREVEPYVDESEEGKIRDASQKTPSVIAKQTLGEADASDADAAGGEEGSDSEE